MKWKAGDQCRAVFSEDGLVYDAEILFVDQQAGTCVVRYRGYGNEEEHILDNLKPAPGRRPRPQQKMSDAEVHAELKRKNNTIQFLGFSFSSVCNEPTFIFLKAPTHLTG